MKHAITIAATLFIAVVLFRGQSKTVEAQAPPAAGIKPAAQLESDVKFLLAEIQRLNSVQAQQANQIAALQARLDGPKEQPTSAPVIPQLTKLQAERGYANSCGPAAATKRATVYRTQRRAILPWRRR